MQAHPEDRRLTGEAVQLHLPILVDDDGAEGYRHGVDPDPRYDPRVASQFYDYLREVGAPPSMEDDIGAWVERIRDDPEVRLRSELAEAAGISYSEALRRWGDPSDLAHAIARRILRAEDHNARCQQCGTRPDEWLDFSVPGWPRPVDEPPWKFYLWDCYACDELHELNKGLDADQRGRGMRWQIMPRQEGEPIRDGFSF